MKQSVYLSINPFLPFRFKIGIANDVKRRSGETGALPLFHFRLPYAAWIERGLHGFYSWAHWPASRKWSGWSEYHLCVNPMAACALFLLWPTLPKEAYAAALFVPVPIDAAVILYCIAAFAYGIIVALVIVFGFILLNLLPL
ncbi:MAG TPA: hypothetical protein VLA25_02445 [Methylotenera sp.]|nr:hypothetical protein [Methylotenera sp.]